MKNIQYRLDFGLHYRRASCEIIICMTRRVQASKLPLPKKM